MEKKLSRLFDYQKFEQNPRLQQVIDATNRRYSVQELSAEDMDMVAAAGDVYLNQTGNPNDPIPSSWKKN